jgi:hypothetical protein
MTALFAWLGQFLSTVWSALLKYVVSFWSFVGVLIYLAYQGFVLLGNIMISVGQKLTDMFTGASSIAGSAPCGGDIAQVLATANTFFPVDETFRLMAAMLVGIWIPIGIYRMLKSWMPSVFGITISGGNT